MSSLLRALARRTNATALRIYDPRAARVPVREGDQHAERRGVERRNDRKADRRSLRPQHPKRDLQIVRVDTAHRHCPIGVARAGDDLERATCQRMERIVDDDRRTVGLMNDSG